MFLFQGVGLSLFAQEKTISTSRVVDLEWEPVEDAIKYEIEFVRILAGNKTKKPAKFSVESPSWRGRLNFGLYKMRLRSYDDRKIPGDWTEAVDLVVKVLPPKLIAPIRNTKLKSTNADSETVILKWEESQGASAYLVKIRNAAGDYSDSKQVSETQLKLNLKVSDRFFWNITPIMVDNTHGELPDKEESFTLLGKPLNPVVIQKPISKFVKKLQWSESPRATSYRFALYFKNGKKWKKVSQSRNWERTSIDFDLSQPSGTYRLIVRPQATLVSKSPIAKLEFPVSGGLRTPAAVEEAVLRESIEKPKSFYAIASYFITLMNLEAKDLNSISKLPNAIGGTGRLGVGWHKPEADFGVFGIVDMSGFNIGTENYTFASAEMHGTYKRYWNSNQLVLSGGVFLKELPMVLDDGAGTFTGVNIHRNIGPHAGFRLWHPFSNKLGVQFNGRLYYNVAGSAPNGETINPTFSYQFGVLGSYRIRESLMGFAGYAYRQDNGSFMSPTATQPENTMDLSVTGHYLNFILEYAF